ncbi:MAG TPA: UbiX family flavin prenyltransferase [Terriglobia bacterium]|jgi:4-hydroxy-3-polyprenylbenzoate decarboxylase|nr:UbiX family flavin prenyltransferase [Terriglobia bacterium]
MPSNPHPSRKTVVIGVTGASGAVFARRMLQMLECDERVGRIHLIVSGAGLKVLREELDLDVSRSASIPSALAEGAAAKTEYLLDSDIGASIASGSYRVDGMVIIPCSTGCLAQVAHGISSTLIERAADVCLKEGRKLVLAVRDTPLSRVHLRNMLLAQEAGADIFPIMPAFYHRPQTIDDLVTQYCCRVLAHLDLEQNEQFRWKGERSTERMSGKQP